MRPGKLTSVAEAVLGSFVSRNNDVDGWWAIGLLASWLQPPKQLTIDLLAGTSHPDLSTNPSGLRALPRTWSAEFARLLDAQHIRSRPRRAGLHLQFLPNDRSRPRDFILRRDVPDADLVLLRAEAEIEDNAGRLFSAATESLVLPHDERAERRSAGANRIAKRHVTLPDAD
jgi:hypothetical protein